MPFDADRPLAVVTDAASGIGLHLAKECAHNGFDLIVSAVEPLDDAQSLLQALGASVETVQADVSTPEGMTRLLAAIAGRPVEALLTGALSWLEPVGRDMRSAGRGRILVTEPAASFLPGGLAQRGGVTVTRLNGGGDTSDPAALARCGFDAMMAGEDSAC
jgi:hypothetical protein